MNGSSGNITEGFNNILKHFFPWTPNQITLHKAVTQSFAKLRELLKKNTFTPEQLNERASPLQLSALAVAVLKNDSKSAELLVNSGAEESLVTQDALGNTPAHLAAMAGDWTLVNKLQALADKTQKQFKEILNNFGGTVESLRSITRLPVSLGDQPVAWFSEREGVLVPLTGDAYKKLTGTTFCNYTYSTPNLLCKDWVTKATVDRPRNPFKELLYKAYLANPPKLFLEEQVDPESKAPIGLGVKAGEDIRKHSLLTPYGGEWIDLAATPVVSPYLMEEVEPRDYSNVASRFNDGMPNAFTCKTPMSGCPESQAIYSLREIKKGEMLTIHYGSHPCKWGHYALFYKELLEEYCKNTDFEERFKEQFARLLKIKSTMKDITTPELFKLSQWSVPLFYILDTPRALVHLAARKLLTPEKLHFMEEANKHCRAINVNDHKTKVLIEFRKSIGAFLTELNKTEPEFEAVMLHDLDRLFAKHCVSSALLMIKNVNVSQLYKTYKENPQEFKEGQEALFHVCEGLDSFIELAPDLCHDDKRKAALEEMEPIYESLKDYGAPFFALLVYLPHYHDVKVGTAVTKYILKR